MTRRAIQSVTVEVGADGRPVFETALAALQQAAGGGYRASSGEAPVATTDDSPVTLIDADAAHVFHTVRIINEGAAGGFYSVDGGSTWDRLPGECALEDARVRIDNQAIRVKRAAGGANLSDVYASAW